jgi:F-type H+-transporting ATPase subunit c
MEGDIVQMGAYIGAGLACTGMGGAAVGVGHVVGNFLSGALRNPSAAAGQTATMFIGIAFAADVCRLNLTEPYPYGWAGQSCTAQCNR